MTPERWRRVEELYHAALTRGEDDRRAFLSDAALATRHCGARWNRCSRSRPPIPGFSTGPRWRRRKW